ncbi:hypothetical protein Trydic_g11069 [Trypoxylus dichotomus]
MYALCTKKLSEVMLAVRSASCRTLRPHVVGCVGLSSLRSASGGDINSIETEKPRLAPSARQVHPVCEDKAQLLAYDKHPNVDPNHHQKRPSIDLNASPPPYPKRASLDSNPSPTSYPLTPNIIVEAGRIEFVKPNADGAAPFVESTPTPPTTPRIGSRITVTRAQQTSDDEEPCFDDTKEKLEARVLELEAALEAAQKSDLKDKQTLAKLQRQLSRVRLIGRKSDGYLKQWVADEAAISQDSGPPGKSGESPSSVGGSGAGTRRWPDAFVSFPFICYWEDMNGRVCSSSSVRLLDYFELVKKTFLVER